MDSPTENPNDNNISDRQIVLRRLALDEKKAEQ